MTQGRSSNPTGDDGLSQGGGNRFRAPSRRAATLWSLGLSYSALMLQLMRNIVLVPVFLRYIELEEYGAWLATGATLAYLMISDFGLMGVVTQRTASAYGARRFNELAQVIGTSLIVSGGLSLVLTLLASLLAPIVPRVVQLSAPIADRLVDCFLILVLANGVHLLAVAGGNILYSLQRPRLPGVTLIVADAASIVVTLLLLVNGWGLYAIALGYLARSLISLVGNGLACLWVCQVRLGLSLRWSSEQARALVQNSSYEFFTFLSLRVQDRADWFFVGMLLGPESAAVYALTIRAHETVRLVAANLSRAVIPSLAHLHGDGNTGRFREVFHTLATTLGVLGAVGMAGVLAFNNAFIALWVGSKLNAGLAVNALYAVFGLMTLVGAAPYNSLQSFGRFPTNCRIMVSATVIRLPLMMGLLPFGMWGAAAAAAVAGTFQAGAFYRALFRTWDSGAPALRRVGLDVLRTAAAPVTLAVIGLLFLPQATSWPVLLLEAALFALIGLLCIFWLNPAAARIVRREILHYVWMVRRSESG